MKRIAGMVMCLALVAGLSACSTTQCASGQKALASAQVAYDAAVVSGNAKQIERYRWTLDAAQAIVAIWCSTQGEELVK